jgi:hypothetical protein
MDSVPPAISDIKDAEDVRIVLFASNQLVHAPLIAAVETSVDGKLIPPGGDEGQVLTKASGSDSDVVWSSRIGIHSWVNFDGTGTISSRDEENVLSLVDNGTGDYTVNFGSSVGTGASVTVTAGDSGTPGLYTAALSEITTTRASFQIYDSSGSAADVNTICVQVFGRLFNFLALSGDQQDDGLDKIALEGDMATGVLLLTPSQV